MPDEAEAPWVGLSAAEMRQVMRGDRAEVRLMGTDSRGRAVGEIVEVLERGSGRIVGRLRKEHGVLILVPEDRRITQDILIPEDAAARSTSSRWLSLIHI